MRLGLMETTDDGKWAATLLGAGALCAAAHLIDILRVGLSDPDSATLTVNVALLLDLMVWRRSHFGWLMSDRVGNR